MDGWLWRAASEVVPLSTAMPAGCDGGGACDCFMFSLGRYVAWLCGS